MPVNMIKMDRCCMMVLLVATSTLVVCNSPVVRGWGEHRHYYYDWMEVGMEGAGGWESCDETYVVKEGETLQSISAKCNDPYILEENPHIQEDDVYPGLVIRITPFPP